MMLIRTVDLFDEGRKVFPKYVVLGVSPETIRSQGGNLRFTVGFSVHAELAQ